MKRKRTYTIIVVVMALVGLLLMTRIVTFPTPAGGRWPSEGVASLKDAPQPLELETSKVLNLKASTEKREYVLGEPIWVYVILENASSASERVWGLLRPEDGAVSILVSGEGREEVFIPMGRSDNDETAFVKIPAGQQIGDVFAVFFGADGWTFTEPGEYQLTVTYETPLSDGKFVQVHSEPFTVTVKGDEVGAILVSGDEASLDAGKFMLWQGGDHLTAGQDLMTDLVERFPESALASYIHFALGRSLSESFMDYGNNEVRPPNCELAARHLNQVDLGVVSILVQVQIKIARARCLAFEEKFKAALESLSQARETAGSGAEFGPLLKLISEYEENLYVALEEQG